ncbi:MAG: ATP-grasp domain-containing protein [Hyphomicrobiales bacterium]|nr:ATP-grasp domain-containing protein [Hyphomicrobiales bacterium]
MRRRPILIAAFSGRSLAEAARRAGYEPYVADLFADADAIKASAAHIQVPGDLTVGLDRGALFDALRDLTAMARPDAGERIPVVCGSGFEAAPDALNDLAAEWRVIANRAQIVRLIKNPFVFQEVCRSLGVPHPETARLPPKDGRAWLAKGVGGAGGGHIRRANEADGLAADRYYQREVAGRAVSTLFIGDGGGHAAVIGFSEQWASPAPGRPLRYGGAVRPADIDDDLREGLARATKAIARCFALVGLNSADFLVEGREFFLLEVNPRPGATLEIFDSPNNLLFEKHLAAFDGARFQPEDFAYAGACASQVVFADAGDARAPDIAPPEWVKDRPTPGHVTRAHHPLCTVLAKADTLSECKRLCVERGRLAHRLYYNL